MSTIQAHATIPAPRQGRTTTLVKCASCCGTGRIVYLAVGDGEYSTHKRPCLSCDQFGVVAVSA